MAILLYGYANPLFLVCANSPNTTNYITLKCVKHIIARIPMWHLILPHSDGDEFLSFSETTRNCGRKLVSGSCGPEEMNRRQGKGYTSRK